MYLYYRCLYNDNIVDQTSDHSQVLRIDCDAPMTTEHTTDQTTKQTTTYVTMTRTSNNDEYSSKTTTNYISTQTTESLQSTTKRTKEDTIYNDQITGNIMGIYVVNRDDITPYYVKADDEYSLKILHNK
jgi:uncharacterized protein YuzE